MEIGHILNEKYRIEGKLGSGGMGSVYLAHDLRDGSHYAVKEIKRKSDEVHDCGAEPDMLKRLSHPALPRLYDIIENESSVYLIVEYINGRTLSTGLDLNGPVSEDAAAQWGIQLCEVLGYLHSQKPHPVIYRDMKPSNIMLQPDGQLKLIDFGIAREYKSRASNDTVFIGTRGYAAPEQYGTGQTSAASDIYSLGATLYHLITGCAPDMPPYVLKPVRTINPEITLEMERIIAKCTRQEPSERYQSAAELRHDLELLIKGAKVSIPDKNKYCGYGSVSFKKLIVTIWDNAEFGCEFAYIAAKLSGYNVLLLDLDLLAPKADMILNVEKYCDRYLAEGKGSLSVFDSIMSAMGSNCFSSELLYEISRRKADVSNLYIVTGSYELSNYEYFSDENLNRLIDAAYRNFDLTVILANRSIYDSFTALSLLKSDYNIAAIKAEPVLLREFNNYAVFLKDKQDIPIEKLKFVFFEYDRSLHLSPQHLLEITQGNMIGTVGCSRRRVKYRNMRNTYARRMEPQIVYDYKQLLSYFKIVPKANVFERLRDILAFRWKALVPKGGFSNAVVKNP